jgi:acetyl-CoA carboxylase alpha subunit
MAEKAAENLKLTAKDMLQLGVVEKVILESLPESAFHIIRNELSAILPKLASMDGEELAEQRYRRYRRIGSFN